MVRDMVLTSSGKGTINVKFSKEFVRNISKEIARKIAEEIYYESLFLRYLPEIKAVEEKRIKAKRREGAIKFLESISKRANSSSL